MMTFNDIYAVSIHLGQQISMEELKKSFPSLNESVRKCLIGNKVIHVNDASSFTDDRWKTLSSLIKTWSSVVVLIDHQYYGYIQVHEPIGYRKTTFFKQHCSGNCRPAFGRHFLIHKLKDNEADKRGAEGARISTNARRSRSTCNSFRHWEHKTVSTNFFVCSEIRRCDSSVYNEGELGVTEYKGPRGRLMDVANAIAATNTVDLLTESVKIWM